MNIIRHTVEVCKKIKTKCLFKLKHNILNKNVHDWSLKNVYQLSKAVSCLIIFYGKPFLLHCTIIIKWYYSHLKFIIKWILHLFIYVNIVFHNFYFRICERIIFLLFSFFIYVYTHTHTHTHTCVYVCERLLEFIHLQIQ